MSEHTYIKGNCDYVHMPYREINGFTYCKHCKQFVDKIEIQFHEGWLSDWMQVVCCKCNKTIWTMEFGDENKDAEKPGIKIYTKDDKKCCICGKPTNHYDCRYSSFGGRNKKKTVYICSNKCAKIDEKLDREWFKKRKEKKK